VTATRASEAQIVGLIDGYLTTQLLYVAAKLGVAEVLADGPRTTEEVAVAIGADVSGAVTLEDGEKRVLARWGVGEGELPDALAAPVWGRYALFRGHPRITGLLVWDVKERCVLVAGERGGEKFDRVLVSKAVTGTRKAWLRETAKQTEQRTRTPLPTVAESDIVAGHDSATEREAADRDRRRRRREIRPSGRRDAANPRSCVRAAGCGEHTVRWSPTVTTNAVDATIGTVGEPVVRCATEDVLCQPVWCLARRAAGLAAVGLPSSAGRLALRAALRVTAAPAIRWLAAMSGTGPDAVGMVTVTCRCSAR
jgi:hypothetical protein